MFARNYNIFISVIGLGLCFILSNAAEECDPKSCPGPLYYYEEIGCTPIFENVTSCCPTSYNCDIWQNITSDQCWVEGRLYNVSQELPARFTSDPCFFCRCSGDEFLCSNARCTSPRNQRPGCRYPLSSLTCCQFYEICEDSPVVCNVDGKSYKVGETFTPVDEPRKTCYCREGYDGINDERFCVWRKSSWCHNVIHKIEKIRHNCTPTYRKNAVLYKDCNIGHVCPKAGIDTYVIESQRNNGTTTLRTLEPLDPGKQCKWGHLTMNIGDKSHATRLWETSVSCVCEVPPFPTCYEIEDPENETI